MEVHYHTQDLVNGGYKVDVKQFNFTPALDIRRRPEVYPARVIENPRNLAVNALRSMKNFGGWTQASWPGTASGWMPYVSVVWLPKFVSCLSPIRNHRIVTMGGDISKWIESFNSARAIAVQDIKSNDGYPRDPVPRGPERELWVEKFMWSMGFSRSFYKPTFAEQHPHLFKRKRSINGKSVDFYTLNGADKLIKEFLRGC